MAKANEVLAMLIPQGGYVAYGDAFEDIQFLECKPITKAEFQAGFDKVDAWKAEQNAKLADDRASAEAKLAALGLTVDDLKALGF